MQPSDPIPLALSLRGVSRFAILPKPSRTTKGAQGLALVVLPGLRSAAFLYVPFDRDASRQLGDCEALALVVNACCAEVDALRSLGCRDSLKSESTAQPARASGARRRRS